jgi:RimJ/RimL family protein N-acetyltransferase
MIDASANPLGFRAFHVPALERNEARHSVILATLGVLDRGSPAKTWTLGSPGQCAVMTPGWPVVLADLQKAQCHELAEASAKLEFPGVVGPDLTAKWFAERAMELGLKFLDPVPQQIHALNEKPAYPGASGHAQQVTAADAQLFADWTIAFMGEATPHDPQPLRDRLTKVAGEGRHLFWIVDGEPVAMAGIARRTRNCAAISGVYTPPSQRGRGYAGSVTAALVERVFAEGRAAVCLYTDLRNPFSNRCYAKIGFKPLCASWHFPRDMSQG